MRAVVVGAGLGGLCAAHGLRQAGADVEVLEAQDKISDSGQGYRINVNAAGHDALRACLATEHFRAYERTLHRQCDPAVYRYSPAPRLLSRDVVPMAPGAIDRGTLRRVLADGLDGRIRFGCKVTWVDQAGTADLIVAADGTGSALRRELLPQAGPRPLGLSAIFGRSPLTSANRGWTAPVLLNSRFCGLLDDSFVLALGGYDPLGTTTSGTAAAAGTASAGFAAAPYLMWVLLGPAGQLPGYGTAAGELVRFAQDRTASWDPRATWVLREATAADSFLVCLRAVTQLPVIPDRAGVPLAFLGDSIHAMSPAGGEGANTAFSDAALLISQLRAHLSPQRPRLSRLLTQRGIAAAVARYHGEMRSTAGAALNRSANYPTKELPHVADTNPQHQPAPDARGPYRAEAAQHAREY